MQTAQHEPMRGRAVGSALVVVTAGILLHYAWDWSGRSPFVSFFAATNESTWEHLKLAFWPALLLASVHWWLYRRPSGWLVATTVRVLVPSVLIVVLFYGYTSILGTHHLALDIATFVVAVFAGEFAGHSLMDRRFTSGIRVLAAAGLVLAVVAFSTFTFSSPSWFLFEDPSRSAQQ